MELNTLISSIETTASNSLDNSVSTSIETGELTTVDDIFAQSGLGNEIQSESPVDIIGNAINSYTEYEQALDAKVENNTPAVNESGDIYDKQFSFVQAINNVQEVYMAKSLTSSLIMATGKSSESFVKTLMRSQ